MHLVVHHKGNSVRYMRSTCTAYGLVSQEERYPISAETLQGPETCKHTSVDHRGSTTSIRRTFCIECRTYTDEVSREIHTKEVETHLTHEGQYLVNGVANHGVIYKMKVSKALELMIAESMRLNDGEYEMLDIGNLFIDCCDRAWVVPAVFASSVQN